MFGKLFGNNSKNEEKSENDVKTVERISKMNLTDMRLYVKNKITELEVTEEGLNEVMKRLTTPMGEEEEYYLKEDDMDSKKKKAFDLVLLISTSRKISVESLELIEKFREVYKDLIDNYDDKNKDIYDSRFKKALETAIVNINTISQVKKKLDVLK